MKKSTYQISGILLAVSIVTAGCGPFHRQPSGAADTSELKGVWSGYGNALGKDKSYRCEYLNLIFDDKGNFSLDDIEQGTTNLSGTFSMKKNSSIRIQTKTDGETELPAGWEDLKNGESLTWQMPKEGRLILTYNDISYFFKKQGSDTAEASSDTSDLSLLDLAETDIWYSNNGGVTSDATYELALYDNYAELYCISAKDQDKTGLLTNFLYLSREKDIYHFCTLKDNDKAFPEFFNQFPEGMSEADIRLTAADDTLTMESGGQKMVFYNNVIYGLETASDVHSLTGTGFYWRFDNGEHFCYFTKNPRTDSLYLYVTDGKKGDTKANVICGEIAVDESRRIITFTFDKTASKKTSKTSSALYRYFKKLCETDGYAKLSYRLEDSVLTLTLDEGKGNNWKLPLEDYETVSSPKTQTGQ